MKRLPWLINNLNNNAMKKIVMILCFLIFILPAVYSQQQPIRLIVRGDDMGYSHAGNEAILKCAKEGIQTALEVIVPSPWFPEAVKMLEENPSIDV